jgi:hypothetical protein
MTVTLDPDAAAEAPIAPCSDLTRAVGDDPVGSGTEFRTFLLLDQRGPWGRDAAGDAVRELLAPHAGATVHAVDGLRAFAVRPVTDRRQAAGTPAWAGRVGHRATITALPELPDAPAVTQIAAGTLGGAALTGVLVGVCTNAKRDRCCAVRGRPVAAALQQAFGERVMEISHLGGHRFAATMLILPTGYSYGFLDPASAHTVVAAALDGLVHPAHLRGRADLSGPAQAADAFWRTGIGPAPVDDVRIGDEQSDGDEAVVQAVVQGTADRVLVRRITGPDIRETVCGGKPISTGRWVVQRG